MEAIREFINWSVIIVGIWALIRYLIQKKIESYFNKQLENYKKELAVLTENAKYDISKKLFDFEAYASKKHAVYPELYSLAFETWTELKWFRFSFDAGIADSKKDLDADKLISYFHEKLEPITEKISDAYNYFYKNELYLSKNTATAYEEVLRSQSIFIQRIANSFYRNYRGNDWKDPTFWLITLDQEDFDKVDEKVRILKETIYKELSYTHFEEAKKKEEALS